MDTPARGIAYQVVEEVADRVGPYIVRRVISSAIPRGAYSAACPVASPAALRITLPVAPPVALRLTPSVAAGVALRVAVLVAPDITLPVALQTARRIASRVPLPVAQIEESVACVGCPPRSPGSLTQENKASRIVQVR